MQSVSWSFIKCTQSSGDFRLHNYIYIYIYMCVCVCVCVCTHAHWRVLEQTQYGSFTEKNYGVFMKSLFNEKSLLVSSHLLFRSFQSSHSLCPPPPPSIFPLPLLYSFSLLFFSFFRFLLSFLLLFYLSIFFLVVANYNSLIKVTIDELMATKSIKKISLWKQWKKKKRKSRLKFTSKTRKIRQ